MPRQNSRRRNYKKNPPNFWSVSRWNVWRECPRKYKYKCIDKLPDPPGRAAERGTEIHLLQEEYLKGNITGMPNALKKVSKQLRKAKSLGAGAEEDWTLTEDLEITHAKDWDRAWLRMKVDTYFYFEDENHLAMVDLKTGKIKPYTAQKEIYVAFAKPFFPKVKSISIELWFSDHGYIDDEFDVSVSQADELTEKWVERSKRMLSDRKFPATPSPKSCKWCPYRSDKTMANGDVGPCSQWKFQNA